jgi:uncharacterized protein YndB with AHSA1/START domain
MANDFVVKVEIAAPIDAVWELAGHPSRIVEWFGPVVSVRMDGDVRYAVMGNGHELVERITHRDDARQTYTYEVIEGIPDLISHAASISAEVSGGGSLVSWRQTATSSNPDYDIESRLRGVMEAGLTELRAQLEAAQ